MYSKFKAGDRVRTTPKCVTLRHDRTYIVIDMHEGFGRCLGVQVLGDSRFFPEEYFELVTPPTISKLEEFRGIGSINKVVIEEEAYYCERLCKWLCQDKNWESYLNGAWFMFLECTN